MMKTDEVDEAESVGWTSSSVDAMFVQYLLLCTDEWHRSGTGAQIITGRLINTNTVHDSYGPT